MRLHDDHHRGARRTPSALVLLAGSGRLTEFTGAIDRPVLDLPLIGGISVLEDWCHQAEELSGVLGSDPFPVRLLVDQESRTPGTPEHAACIEFQVLRDPFAYRGTAGVLADLARGYGDDDVLLIANATQLNFIGLASQYRLIAEADAGVALVAPVDGTPVSVMLVRCGTLREVPEVGFFDLKEQALAGIAERFGVHVARAEHPVSLPLRTAEAYIMALRERCRLLAGAGSRAADPYEEVWQSRFSIIEDGGRVDDSAQVHDSVVLRGAVLDPSSVAVRSVVCAGGRIRKGEVVIEKIVTAPAGSRPRAGHVKKGRG